MFRCGNGFKLIVNCLVQSGSSWACHNDGWLRSRLGWITDFRFSKSQYLREFFSSITARRRSLYHLSRLTIHQVADLFPAEKSRRVCVGVGACASTGECFILVYHRRVVRWTCPPCFLHQITTQSSASCRNSTRQRGRKQETSTWSRPALYKHSGEQDLGMRGCVTPDFTVKLSENTHIA